MIIHELLSVLEGIVGKDNVSTEAETLSAYFKSKAKAPGLALVTPVEASQVEEIVKFAKQRGIPIYTARGSKYCSEEISSKEGILLDLKKMNQILEVDPLNLLAIIEPGVTFPQFIRAVKAHDDKLNLAMPVAADSTSVMYSYMNRNVTSRETTLRGRNINVSNFHVVLPDGNVFKSGTHAISEQDHVPDIGIGFGSLVFYGTGDALGIPVKAVVWTFPVQECRRVMTVSFPDISKARAFLQDSCRKDRFTEAFAANSLFLSVILAKDGVDIEMAKKDLPPWVAVGSLEGSEELVTVTREVLSESVKELGGKEIEGDYLSLMASSLDRPWYLWDRDVYRGASCHIPFHTHFRRIPEFNNLFIECMREKKYPVEEIGQLIVPVKQARSVYCEYDLYFEPAEEKKYKDLYNLSFERLVKAGAYVDRPGGKIADLIHSQSPAVWRLQRDIKKKIDPMGILNPDQLIAKEV